MKNILSGTIVGLFVLAALPTLHAQDPLETETARFLKQGAFKLVNTVEYQKSSDGTEKYS